MADGSSARRSALANAMAAATAACLLAAIALIALSPSDRVAAVASIRLGEALALGVPWMAFSIVGAIIVRHQPDNVVGWLCSIGGLEVALVALAVGIATRALTENPPLPVGVAAAWAAHVGSITIVAAPLLILFRFPTGRSLGQWWWRAELMTLGWVGVMILIVALDPMPLLGFPAIANPLGVGDVSRLRAIAFTPAIACAGLAVVSLVVRFQRGSLLERRQIRLLAAASVLVGVAIATITLTSPDLLSGGELRTQTAVINAIAFSAIPVAIGVAIVRANLYEIDRLVSRTLVYALVSAVLASVYVVAVIGLSAVIGTLAPKAGNTPAIAGSTLLVASLFGPVRARAQIAIDRRFNRERYEGNLIIAAFAGDVRSEVELDAIVGHLRRAAVRTVHPSTTGCWIRGRPASRSFSAGSVPRP